MILHGDAGYVSSDAHAPKNIYLHAVKEGLKNFLRRISGRKIKPLSYSYHFEAYYKELQHFFNCIMNDSDPLVSTTDGLKTIEIIEEAYRNSASNQFPQGA